jgi:SAM-dependent methyltransferase
MLADLVARWTAPRFACPLCGFIGRFRAARGATGTRPHATCSRCGCGERHRLAWAAARHIIAGRDALLHVAPEAQLSRAFQKIVRRYATAGLEGSSVDARADLTCLPFRDGAFDAVFASHVLEHIRDDVAALREVRRVLRPGGVALLPVPVTGSCTVEYPIPNRFEHGHVRAPGADYFARFRDVFPRVDVITSEDVSARFQTYVYEDRSAWPFETLRPTVPGNRHAEVLPICYA